MLTELGKTLRKYRIDNELLLKDMANKIGMSVSALSYIETGKRKPPVNFLEKLSSAFQISDEIKNKIQESVARQTVKFDVVGNDKIETALVLARGFNNLSEEKLEEIRKIMEDK
jgi:transcriptional regulator with XRE-family HTH domain